jgi:hypothetical protein
MNREDGCYTRPGKGSFRLPVDEQGNSIITGELNQDNAYCTHFTCIDFEVFSVLYDIHPYEDPNFKNYLIKQINAMNENE